LKYLFSTSAIWQARYIYIAAHIRDFKQNHTVIFAKKQEKENENGENF